MNGGLYQRRGPCPSREWEMLPIQERASQELTNTIYIASYKYAAICNISVYILCI